MAHCAIKSDEQLKLTKATSKGPFALGTPQQGPYYSYCCTFCTMLTTSIDTDPHPIFVKAT